MGMMAAESRADDLSPDPADPAAIAAVRALPGFRSAAETTVVAAMDVYDGNRLVNRVLNDRGRFVLSLLALHLHMEGTRGRGGLTVARLQELCAACEVCSPGRVAAVVAAMRLLGLLAPTDSADRRERRLAATDRFFALHAERLGRMLEGAASLFPEVRPIRARIAERAVLGAFGSALVGHFLGGYRIVAGTPELTSFVDRDGGVMTLFSLFRAALEAGGPELGADVFTVAETARRLHLSRAQVAGTLKLAETEGLLLRIGRPAEQVVLEPAFFDVLERFVGGMFHVHRLAAREASAQAASD